MAGEVCPPITGNVFQVCNRPGWEKPPEQLLRLFKEFRGDGDIDHFGRQQT